MKLMGNQVFKIQVAKPLPPRKEVLEFLKAHYSFSIFVKLGSLSLFVRFSPSDSQISCLFDSIELEYLNGI